MLLVPWILSLSVHEWAHAWSAYKLGDDTASREGRLTLNPISHIDPFGTIIAPLLGLPIAWAKPVPVNPLRFRRDVTMKAGMMITAAAGPISNLILAVALAVLYGLMIRFGMPVDPKGAAYFLIVNTILLNVSLMVFNFIPIPPLDGSRIVDGLLPYRLRPQWEQFQRFGFLVLLALVFFGSSLLAAPIRAVMGVIVKVIGAVAGAA
jgi:Zn-dependent protease